MAKQTCLDFLVNATAFLGFIMVTLSGIAFLAFPSNRAVNSLHAISGALTILAIVVHIVHHWQWIKTMSRRSVESLVPGRVTLPKSARLNVVINAWIAVVFLATIVSGFMLDRRSEIARGSVASLSGGEMPGSAASLTVQWEALDFVHIGAVIALAGLASIHILVHWRWIKNAAGSWIESLGQEPGLSGQSLELD